MGDKIAELYLGRAGSAFSAGAMEEARERIGWMCEQARGGSILDAGCSQGITALLLARAGRRALGVDPDPEAIAHARRMLADEAAGLDGRLEYLLGDLDHPDLDGRRFSTAIAGEVIEHLADPGRFLRRLHQLLEPGGTAIITTPFALTSHKDHHQIFFLSSFHRLVAPLFATRELVVRCKKIRFAGIRRDAILDSDDPEPEIRADLLRRTEEAILDLERSYYLPRLAELKRKGR